MLTFTRSRKLWQGVRFILTALMVAVVLCAGAKHVASQTRETNASERKVVTRVEPEYPETLKRLYIGGVVRVEVVVGANGAVQTAELVGGNPILGQSAMKAIKQWKYASGAAKEKLIVQLEFDPH